jgi:hypothetical protein
MPMLDSSMTPMDLGMGILGFQISDVRFEIAD